MRVLTVPSGRFAGLIFAGLLPLAVFADNHDQHMMMKAAPEISGSKTVNDAPEKLTTTPQARSSALIITDPVNKPRDSVKNQSKPKSPAREVVNIPEPAIPATDPIKDAAQARELSSIKEAAGINMVNSPENLGGTNPDLGLGGNQADLPNLPGHNIEEHEMPEGTEYLPELPSNKDKGPARIVDSPSGDFAGIMAGAASNQDATVEKDQETGRVSKMVTYDETTADGERRTVTNTWVTGSNPEDNYTVQENTYYWGNGRERSRTATHTFQNGSGFLTQSTFNRRGRETRTTQRFFDRDGNWEGDAEDIAYMPRDDMSSDGRSYYDHSAKSTGPTVTYVNPGPDGTTLQQANTLQVPDEQLVINPSPEDDLGSGAISEEQARALSEQLQSEVAGGATPGANPGDPDSVEALESSGASKDQ